VVICEARCGHGSQKRIPDVNIKRHHSSSGRSQVGGDTDMM